MITQGAIQMILFFAIEKKLSLKPDIQRYTVTMVTFMPTKLPLKLPISPTEVEPICHVENRIKWVSSTHIGKTRKVLFFRVGA